MFLSGVGIGSDLIAVILKLILSDRQKENIEFCTGVVIGLLVALSVLSIVSTALHRLNMQTMAFVSSELRNSREIRIIVSAERKFSTTRFSSGSF